MPRATAIVIGLILATLNCLTGAGLAQAFLNDPVSDAIDRMSQAAGAPVETSRSPVTGLVTFMSTPAGPIGVPLPATAHAEARARAFLQAHGRAFGVADAGDAAHLRSRGPDNLGMEHVRFRQLHAGVPVTGGELTVHLRGVRVVGVNGKILDLPEPVDTNPTVSADGALAAAETVIARRFGLDGIVFSRPRLEVFSRGMLEARRAQAHLAWFIEARRIDVRQFIWIDAHTGLRLLDFSQLTDALKRSIYDANGGHTLPGTLVRSEGQAPTGDGDADAAYDFSGDTYNYFRTQHGRDSYDGAGATLISTVHYCPSNDNCNYQNAFWNGTQMVYGNGFSAADDVDAHELTHAVTEHSANLFYYMQSGALNESFSDIFGETVDLLNGAGTDTAATRWLLAEDVPGIGAIPNMMNPNAFNDPGKMSDAAQFNCTTPGNDGGGVHTNSGVPNHAYALMVDGGTYNGFTVTGIGLIKAGKVQYRALTTYLLSASDFLDNYNALKQSCSDLIGTAGITAGDCTEVGKALDAVEMANPWPCSPPQAAVPLFCAPGQVPSNVFFDNLENTFSGNWAITTLSGNSHWYYPGSVNPLEFGPFATSGVNNFWGYNRPDVGDSAIAMTSSVAIPAGARLQFNHSYGFERDGAGNWDGGVIEYSTDGGTSWLDAGSLISAGAAYGGAISSGDLNPLAGRNAFVGDSFGYTASQLDLSGLAGQNVRFRFRMGTDSVFDDYGWFIDDVRTYVCAVPPAQPFRDVRRAAEINVGADLGGTGHVALNFTGLVGSAGDTWISVYDAAPQDSAPTVFTGNVHLSADVLIHRFNNAKGGGLLALYNEAPGKKGLALIISDAGNTDQLVLASVDQGGKLKPLKTVALGAGIRENAWYRVTMDVVVAGHSVDVTGRVFRHAIAQDADSGLGVQVGPTLIFNGARPGGVDVSGQVGIIAFAVSAVVDTSITNFGVVGGP
jgi:Zn-dependent metalloprotease